ncbi:hypothetical protein WBP07_02985 [Novosphingobium sp. BL-8A]|uniref:hypothetical protein n=1 Tax=Novosphingobium sp. BL-8A TaxID=3127639 RepID=UPI0037567180
MHARPSRIARIVGPLVDTLVDEQCATVREDARAQVRAYMLATLAAMPDFFRLGFHILAYLFEFTPILHGERRFSRLVLARRQAHVARWRGSSLGPMRSMIAFYASFSAYGLYSAAYPAAIAEGGRIAA